MKEKDKLMNIFADSECFSVAQAKAAGVHPQNIKNLVDKGELFRVARGLYSFDENWDDEMLVMQNRFKRGIYSHDTALFLHGYSDRTPFMYDLTFPQGYNFKTTTECNLNARHVVPDNYNLGICKVRTTMGNEVVAYNLERTLCDILRGNGSNIEIIRPAMRKYVESKEKNIPLLLEYAEQLHVKPKILKYLEVLL